MTLTFYNFYREEEIKLLNELITEKEVMVDELHEKYLCNEETVSDRFWSISLQDDIRTLQGLKANCEYRLNKNIKKENRIEALEYLGWVIFWILLVVGMGIAPLIVIILTGIGVI